MVQPIIGQGQADANGAKMGQTVRQSMPSSAIYAYLQTRASDHYSQQSRGFPSKFSAYSYTIGVCFVRDD